MGLRFIWVGDWRRGGRHAVYQSVKSTGIVTNITVGVRNFPAVMMLVHYIILPKHFTYQTSLVGLADQGDTNCLKLANKLYFSTWSPLAYI